MPESAPMRSPRLQSPSHPLPDHLVLPRLRWRIAMFPRSFAPSWRIGSGGRPFVAASAARPPPWPPGTSSR
eukprot:210972-Pyramimonas_sp.AAC.1